MEEILAPKLRHTEHLAEQWPAIDGGFWPFVVESRPTVIGNNLVFAGKYFSDLIDHGVLYDVQVSD